MAKTVSVRIKLLRQVPPGGRAAEVGVFEGDFSEKILRVAKPEKLYLIDPWENFDEPGLENAMYGAGSEHDMAAIYEDVRARFDRPISRGRVEMLRSRSQDALGAMGDGTLDFIYIDGDHRYEGVAADLQDALRVVRIGGLIALDDHGLGGWWGDGVVRATNEALGRHAQALRVVFCAKRQIMLEKTAEIAR
ncbi:MAG: class I SAM-dependent methyltransferase [Pseudomonadota bacterium]